MLHVNITRVNENTLRIHYSEQSQQSRISKTELPIIIAQSMALIQTHFKQIIEDVIPAYSTLTLVFNLNHHNITQTKQEINLLLKHQFEAKHSQNTLFKKPELTQASHTIPTYYGDEVAWDLPILCQRSGISPEEFIHIHSHSIYTVCAIGFAPGFCYLGFLPESISNPRLKTPRPRVAQGSIGIADSQTGIYPNDSPGGWNIIGRTYISTLHIPSGSTVLPNTSAAKAPPHIDTPSNPDFPQCVLGVGSTVKFEAISKNDFLHGGGSLD